METKKSVSQSFICLQESETERVARDILKFHTICRYIVRNKIFFGPLVTQLVWYILNQLFTSVSVKVMDIYLAASRLDKHHYYSPPLLRHVTPWCKSRYCVTHGLIYRRHKLVTSFTQSRTQSPQAFWSAGGRQERLWGTGIFLNFF